MAVKKGYQFRLVDEEAEEEQNLKKAFKLWEEEVESVGGIGNFVESIDKMIGENDRLEMIPFWYE